MDKQDNVAAIEPSAREVISNAPDAEKIAPDVVPGNATSFGQVDMEASINSDDVIRAGGFGATDDINRFLPVASDSTDFEASLRDARDYEEQQQETHRPGLGWTDPK